MISGEDPVDEGERIVIDLTTSPGRTRKPYLPPIDAKELARRNQAAMRLLDEWEQDEAGEEEQREILAVLRAALGEHRIASTRNLFPESDDDPRRWSDLFLPEAPMKPNPVKKALREGKPQVGTWLSLGSVVGARFLARSGLPWLTVDLEHTHTDINTAALMFGAIADAGCVPLARVQEGRHDLIKAVLDCGAMGIVAPMVMGPDEARAIVAATKYPPKGNRSVGGGLHALNYGATPEDYYKHVDDEILVVIQTEHVAAVEVADETYAVPGVDAVFVGPNDLAASLRGPDGTPPSRALMESTLARIREAAARQGIASGLHVFSIDDARRRLEEGWRFVAVNSELKFMMQGAGEVAKAFTSGLDAADVAKY